MKNFNECRPGSEGPFGHTIKEIILQSTTHIVFIDTRDIIQWATHEYGPFPDKFGAIQNTISFWELTANRTFSKNESYEYKCLLAEAYARVLDEKSSELAESILVLTQKRIEYHAKEVLRHCYVLSSFFMTLIVLGLLAFSAFYKTEIISFVGRNAFEVLITLIFGGVGAFVFAMLRLRTHSPEVGLSKKIYWIDGALRVFYGLVSGLIVGIAIKSNVVFGFLNNIEHTLFLQSFIGVIAGASEAAIPSLVRQIEGKFST